MQDPEKLKVVLSEAMGVLGMRIIRACLREYNIIISTAPPNSFINFDFVRLCQKESAAVSGRTDQDSHRSCGQPRTLSGARGILCYYYLV